MKNWLFAFLIAVPLLGAGQSYQSVIENRTAFYQDSTSYLNGQVYAIRIDSSEIIPGGKRLFQYRQLNNNNPVCFGSSWIGSEIIINDDGINIFVVPDDYTSSMDTFKIQTTSIIGESEIFHLFEDDSYLDATCISHTLETVLSGQDSVKTFSLQFKDEYGNNLVSTWNEKVIRLSKSMGLLTFYSLLNVSSSYVTAEINLIGMTNPDEGYELPSIASIFDFSAGDEFDVVNVQPIFWGSWTNHYSRKLILGKTISLDQDTIFYSVSVHKATLSWSNFEFQGAVISDDTITESYVLPSYFPLENLPFQFTFGNPDNPFPNFWYFGGFNQIFKNAFCQRDIIKIAKYFTEVDSTTDCLIEPIGDFIYTIDEFSPGLGLVSSYSADYPLYGTFMQYFKKGSDSCGTPIDFSQFVSIPVVPSLPQIQLFPNLATDKIRIVCSSPIDFIEITDALGLHIKRISELEMSSHYLIDVTDVSSGIYLLNIYFQDQIVIRKVVIQ